MRFLWLGLLLILAVHLVVSTALSLAAAVSLPRLGPILERFRPRRRAAALFVLGLLPALGGLLASVGLALPAWVRHEPRGTGEEAGPVLLLLALGGAVLLGTRFLPAILDHWRTSRLVRRFTADGQALPGFPFRATRLEHPQPVAALAGTFRPRLLLSDTVLRALSPDELEAVVEHERAHAAVGENLRRLLLRGSPDALAFCAAGRSLRTAYEAAAEAAADEAACTRVSPLLLARALVKVAGLAAEGPPLELALAALHREGGIAARVRALLAAHDVSAKGPGAPPASAPAEGLRLRAGALCALAAAAIGLAQAALPSVHRLLESLVHLS